MSSFDPNTFDDRLHVDWRDLYDTPRGKEFVDIRQEVYKCVEPGRQPADYDAEVIQAAGHLAIAKTATMLDIGCSEPILSEKFAAAGYTGLLFGVDPNTKQFNGRPYWRPRKDGPGAEYNQDTIDIDTLLNYFELQGQEDAKGQNIILIEAIANNIPLPDGHVDFITEMFSAYHIPKHLLLDAFLEFMRLLDYDGYNATAISGRNNKAWMHEGQDQIADRLSDMLKKKITPPPPLHIGFTTEEALDLLPTLFNNVAAKFFDEKLIFHTPERKDKVLAAHKTQWRQFKDEQGVPVDVELFDIALEEMVEKELDEGIRSGRPMMDMAHRSIIIVGRTSLGRLLEADDEYHSIAA